MNERPGRPRHEALTLDAAMGRAIDLARLGPSHGPNPQVGCVLLAPPAADRYPAGRERLVLAEGVHHGAGTPHAEVDALSAARAAGRDVRGATAVITLEPCRHTGRTGPCTEALIQAGIAEVVHAIDDPHPRSGGGGALLRAHGVPVRSGIGAARYRTLVGPWLTAITRGRPFVTAKMATSLDGQMAAADGTSQWLTGAAARAAAHRYRSQVDAIVVGTGTVLRDDPALTARLPDGSLGAHQPVRVVLGHRPVPAQARLHRAGGPLIHLPSRDIGAALTDLAERDVRHVLVEGGPTLLTAFFAAGLVDQVHSYIAPVLLGGRNTPAVGDLGVRTLTQQLRWRTTGVQQFDQDVLVTARAAQATGVPGADPTYAGV